MQRKKHLQTNSSRTTLPMSSGIGPFHKKEKMNSRIEKFAIRALVSREKEEFVARALEMDLLGFGATPEDAIDELIESVEAQISFSKYKNDSSMIFFQAEEKYLKRWEEANLRTLKSELLGDVPVARERAVTFSFTPGRIKALGERGLRSTGPVCA